MDTYDELDTTTDSLAVMPDGPIEKQLAHLKKLKVYYRAKAEEAKTAKEQHDAAEAALFAQMRDRGLLTLRTDSGTFTCKETIYGNINDIDAFAKWADAQGLSDEFLKLAPEKRRINELVRDLLQSGEELPEGVNWYPKEYIGISND